MNSEAMNIFDFLPDEEAQQFKPIKSTDWKWSMANDYPKEKNGLKVFSCFACGGGEILRGTEKTRISVEDIIHSQTFPEDYMFNERTFKEVVYTCGMSVPPIMIKRIVTRLIESGVFDYKLKGGDI